MGVRLVKHGVGSGGEGTYDHNLLFNRDMDDQHPISAITGLQEALDNLEFDTKDSTSLHLDFDSSVKELTGSVILLNSDDNAIEDTLSGLFVDKYPDIETMDTETIHLYMSGKGMTLYEMYTDGSRFSHNGGTTNIKNASEANAWYFDSTLQSFVQPLNTTTFTGFVSSPDYMYRTYTHKATMRSNDSDNDGDGLVIAYILDDDGHPHTLSCIINKGGESHVGNWKYAIVYNKSLDGEQVVVTGPTSGGHTTSGWSNHYITMEVRKAANRITCAISNWDSLVINPSTLLEIDLHDYPWGHYFLDKVMYGYCNQSQAKSYFTDISFSGKGPLKADVIISPDDDNALEIRPNGLYCGGGGGGIKNVLKVTQKDHGFKVGEVLYCKNDGTFDKALAENTEKVEAVGVVSEIRTKDVFILTLAGLLQTNIFNSYPNGCVLYLDESTSGKLIESVNLIYKPIAIKIKEGILINIQRGDTYGSYTGGTIPLDFEYYSTDEILAILNEIWT